ncbi:hypothetical protein AAU57_04205 [Nonlabens sp. YIK11]|uniref:DUF4271 domain-containing protein n=1 Tax=Nonlabens sp. YIK11 TaxID=1453349 RepID=UPI0006DBDA1D|nr:DUF4271 domain-containing protein [Nonlabens sp. YIK11]KQC32616.1 hypothetical protein AAU57_04205 [Nonlabens sp. YIK11]
MDALYRITESLDWISIIIFMCLLSFAVARQFTTLPVSEFLSVYVSSRFIKISRDGRIDNHHGYKYLGLIIYGISIALILFKLSTVQNGSQSLTNFILILTAVSTFLIFKHYLSKLLSTIANFEDLLISIDHERNLYRAALSVLLMVIVISIYYIFPTSKGFIQITAAVAGAVIIVYHFLVFYNHRNALSASFFYFILYLCTLEIAPYLLLYKYITV